MLHQNRFPQTAERALEAVFLSQPTVCDLIKSCSDALAGSPQYQLTQKQAKPFKTTLQMSCENLTLANTKENLQFTSKFHIVQYKQNPICMQHKTISSWLRVARIGWDWMGLAEIGTVVRQKGAPACPTSLDSHQLSWGGWDVNSVYWAPALSSGGGRVRLDTLYALLQCSVILSTNTSRESIVYTGSVSATPESGVQIHIHGRPTLADCRAMSFVQIQNWINLPFYTLTPARESAECR